MGARPIKGDEDGRNHWDSTGSAPLGVFITFGGPRAHGHSVEDTAQTAPTPSLFECVGKGRSGFSTIKGGPGGPQTRLWRKHYASLFCWIRRA